MCDNLVIKNVCLLFLLYLQIFSVFNFINNILIFDEKVFIVFRSVFFYK